MQRRVAVLNILRPAVIFLLIALHTLSATSSAFASPLPPKTRSLLKLPVRDRHNSMSTNQPKFGEESAADDRDFHFTFESTHDARSHRDAHVSRRTQFFLSHALEQCAMRRPYR